MFGWLRRLIAGRQEVDRSGLVSPGGLEMVASVGSDKSEMPQPGNEIRVVKAGLKSAKYDCGHNGPDPFSVDLYGLESRPFTSLRKCPNCWVEEAKKVVLRCALCGWPILPGEGVSAYHEGNDLPYKAVAMKVEDCYLGCLRINCCPSGGFYAGVWDGENFISSFEHGRTAAEEAFRTGKPVISNV